METQLLNLFKDNIEYAIIISLLVNIIIAVLGVIPSYFLTGANLIFFGFYQGILISFLGEALGAIISFILYRKGFKKLSIKAVYKYPKLKNIIDLSGRKAFLSVLSLRLMPFIPSGLVTMAAAIGRINLLSFTISSSLGKFPALLIEGITVYQIMSFTWETKLILLIIGIIIFLFAFRPSF